MLSLSRSRVRVSVVLLSICRILFGRDPIWVTGPECNLEGFPNERGESTPGALPFGETMSSYSRGRLSVHDCKVEDNWKSKKKFLVSDRRSAAVDQS